ncbi:MAG: DUF6629 family protein [Thiohalocapsa sp.]
MCFSAEASFAAAAVLVPVGAYSLKLAVQNDRRYIVVASFPLLFGIQQAVEGVLWLGLAGQEGPNIRLAALGFLFFAFWLWPFLVPLSAYALEQRAFRKLVFKGLAAIGFLFGLSLFLPLLTYPDWLAIERAQGSILYDTRLVYDDFIARNTVRFGYAVIISVPLLFSTQPKLRVFGMLILTSVVIGGFVFHYAFISIWCFFAALLSLYIGYMMHSTFHDGATSSTTNRQ